MRERESCAPLLKFRSRPQPLVPAPRVALAHSVSGDSNRFANYVCGFASQVECAEQGALGGCGRERGVGHPHAHVIT